MEGDCVDYRIPLKLHTALDFEGMLCHVEEVVGRGSNAIVYRGWYADYLNPAQKHHVLMKELFPLHPEGKIRRDVHGCIIVEPEGRDHWEVHRQSFVAGNDIHLRLLADHPDLVGANLNSFRLNGTLYSVLGYSGGRSLKTELSISCMNLRQYARRMLGLLDALEAFHKSGYLHLDISPDNVMLVGSGDNERIFLIDYNSARAVAEVAGEHISCKPGYSSPEVETRAVSSIGYASDLYSVAAVFYRCLIGRRLSLEEQLQSRAPDGKMSPCLKDAPETVSSMVSHILRKGLNVLSGKRYQSVGEMRHAFQELIDRIDSVGVTHWALWESGKRSVEAMIRTNPSLRYVKEEKYLYPIRLDCSGGRSLEQYLARTLSPEGESGLILAQGGMGKTTLLLRTAIGMGKRYSASAPAVFYICLNGWNPADTHYIRSQILMSLRFKREMNTFDAALHGLQQLLHEPLKTKNGDLPVVLLLLDGLNEVRGNLEPLLQEINTLDKMAGVRIIAASRNEMPALRLKPVDLSPLTLEDVESVLGEHGLLLPQNPAFMQLLRTPLILSLYVLSSNGGKQLDIHSETELMKAYLDSLYQKELDELSEHAPERWQLDAALHFVLPCIAAESFKTGGALTEENLLKVVERCWRVLRSRTAIRVFPRWIGYSRAIMGDASNAEQWYGQLVHNILWHRLGLLTKEANGGYFVFHQKIAEYLAQDGTQLFRRIRRKRFSVTAAAVTVAACLALLAGAMWMPESYDDKKTQQVIDAVAVCYSSYGFRLSEVQELTRCLMSGDIPEFMVWYDCYWEALTQEAELTAREKGYLTQIDALCESGDQVRWSKRPLDGEKAQTLVTDSSMLLEEYLEYLPLLKGWAQSQRAQREYPDFPEAFYRLLDADAFVMSKLYHQTCTPHMEMGASVWREAIEENVAAVPESGQEPEVSLEKLRSTRDGIKKELVQIASSIHLICQEENLTVTEAEP